MLSAKPRAADSTVIDEATILKAAGDARRLEGVRQLILRGLKLTGFDPSCTPRLHKLTVLSLSNNSLRDLKDFRHLVSLVELNINFNAVTSLQGLPCPGLRKLFMSNNLLASADELRFFPNLNTLCLFNNILPDLGLVLQCLRQLKELQELDLDGNPCARSWGYKHRVIHSCPPGLSQLDGEEVSQLDHDLSELFFEEEQNRADILRRAPDIGVCGDQSRSTRSGEGRYRCGGGGSGRPATAPTSTCNSGKDRGGKGGRVLRCRRERDSIDVKATGAKLGEYLHDRCSSTGVDVGEDRARLLTSDRLNNDPYLLSYLAEDVLADACRSPRDSQAAADSSRDANNGSRPSLIVEDDPNLGGVCAQAEATHRQAQHAVTDGDEGITNTAPSSTLDTTDLQESSVSRTPRRDTRNWGAEGGSTQQSRVVSPSPRKTLSSAEAVSIAESPSVRVGEARNTPGGQEEQDIITRDVLGWSPGDESRISSTDRSREPRGKDGRNSGVGVPVPNRVLRKPGPLEHDCGQHGADTRGCRSPIDQNQTEYENPLLLPPPPPVRTGNAAGIHAWDPYVTIRKLLKLVETLQLERAEYNKQQQQAVDSLSPVKQHESQGERRIGEAEEIRRLRLENRSMHMLLAENRELKRNAIGVKEKEEEIQALRSDVSRLREQLREAGEELELTRGQLRDAKASRSFVGGGLGNSTSCYSEGEGFTSSPTTGSGGGGAEDRGDGGTPTTSVSSWRPSSAGGAGILVTAADVIADCYDVDEELADLFRRNEQTMGQIRRDLALARQQEQHHLEHKQVHEEGKASGGGGRDGESLAAVVSSTRERGRVDTTERTEHRNNHRPDTFVDGVLPGNGRVATKILAGIEQGKLWPPESLESRSGDHAARTVARSDSGLPGDCKRVSTSADDSPGVFERSTSAVDIPTATHCESTSSIASTLPESYENEQKVPFPEPPSVSELLSIFSRDNHTVGDDNINNNNNNSDSPTTSRTLSQGKAVSGFDPIDTKMSSSRTKKQWLADFRRRRAAPTALTPVVVEKDEGTRGGGDGRVTFLAANARALLMSLEES